MCNMPDLELRARSSAYWWTLAIMGPVLLFVLFIAITAPKSGMWQGAVIYVVVITAIEWAISRYRVAIIGNELLYREMTDVWTKRVSLDEVASAEEGKGASGGVLYGAAPLHRLVLNLNAKSNMQEFVISIGALTDADVERLFAELVRRGVKVVRLEQ